MIYWLCKEEVAQAKFSSLRELGEDLGVPLELVADSKLSASYDSARVVSQSISALSNTVEDQLKAETALSKFNVLGIFV